MDFVCQVVPLVLFFCPRLVKVMYTGRKARVRRHFSPAGLLEQTSNQKPPGREQEFQPQVIIETPSQAPSVDSTLRGAGEVPSEPSSQDASFASTPVLRRESPSSTGGVPNRNCELRWLEHMVSTEHNE